MSTSVIRDELGKPVAFDFDLDSLEPRECPVTYRGIKYVLREASEAAAVAYQNAKTRSVRLNAEGKFAGLEGIGDISPTLVSQCLYRAGPDGKLVLKDGRPDPSTLVPQGEIRSWPARIVRQMYDWIMDASDLRETETEESLEKDVAEKTKKLKELRDARSGVKLNGVEGDPGKD